MLKRSIFIENPCLLSITNRQLMLSTPDGKALGQAPAEDLGFVVIDNREIRLTQHFLQLCAEFNIAVIICDEKHMPCSMLMHFAGNTLQSEVTARQIEAPLPLRKQLWMQTIKAKIGNQAALLEQLGKHAEPLRHFQRKVRSGDTGNEEAKAARSYWKTLLGEEFTRDRYGPMPNPALNYGYAILRAAVTRAITGTGLLPVLGIHHKNRYNSFALADDLMEPYRPWVDREVYAMLETLHELDELNKECKVAMLKVLTADVEINGSKSPLTVALSQTTASIAACYAGEKEKISYPLLL